MAGISAFRSDATRADYCRGPTHVVMAGDPAKPPLVARVVMIDAIGDVNKSVATAPITTAAHIVTWLDETLRARRRASSWSTTPTTSSPSTNPK